VPAGVAKNCERLRQMYVETGGSASSGVQGQRAEMLSRLMQGGERGRERNSRGVKPEVGMERRGEVGEGAEGTRQVDQVFAISIITEHGRKRAAASSAPPLAHGVPPKDNPTSSRATQPGSFDAVRFSRSRASQWSGAAEGAQEREMPHYCGEHVDTESSAPDLNHRRRRRELPLRLRLRAAKHV
jgi:hypothetical protein